MRERPSLLAEHGFFGAGDPVPATPSAPPALRHSGPALERRRSSTSYAPIGRRSARSAAGRPSSSSAILRLAGVARRTRRATVSATREDGGDHALLALYAAGSVSAEEASRFREHLATCERCRGELPVWQRLRRAVDEHGAEFLAPCPPAETLEAAMGSGAEGAAAEAARRHLAFCPRCASEAAWIRGDAEYPLPDAAPEAGSAGAIRRASPPARLAAGALIGLAAAAALALLLWPRERSTDDPTGPIAVTYLRPAERGTAGSPNRIVLEPGWSAIHLLLPVDYPAEDFPVLVRLADRAGREVWASRIGREALVGEAYLTLRCARADCGPGAYVLAVEPAADGEPATYEVVVEPPP
jgi:hypothetical protein